jgi:hypothetical protein
MFQRAGVTVSEFYKQTGRKIPDFSLEFGAVNANVEAKLLTTSDVEETFLTYAQKLKDQIVEGPMAAEGVYQTVRIIVKSAHELPEIGMIVNSVKSLFDISGTELRSKHFNLFIDPSTPTTSTLFRAIHILCPRSDKENLRVISRVKDAAQQLGSDDASGHSGILWIGLTLQQDPLAIRNQLSSSFERSRFPNISSVVLSLSGPCTEPPRRSVIDLVTVIKNQKCSRPLPKLVPFQGLDLMRDLNTYVPADAGVAAYRMSSAETRVVAGAEVIRIADIRRIDSRWL